MKNFILRHIKRSVCFHHWLKGETIWDSFLPALYRAHCPKCGKTKLVGLNWNPGVQLQCESEMYGSWYDK